MYVFTTLSTSLVKQYLVSWVYMRVGYVFEPRFSLGKISQFRLFSASLIKNRGTLRRFYLFLVGIIKNV